ncbi:MAG TPA: lipid II flippase MurJ [Acidimicrobiales bacterium]|nr:lipid II flippase MurJ [Acidimicrobiales bacterium]
MTASAADAGDVLEDGAELAQGPPRSVARAAAGMGLATAVSRVVGALRVLVIASVLGATVLGNVFQSSNALSTVLFELLAAGALSAVLVPSFVELLDRGDQRAAEHLAGGVLGRALLGLGVVSLVGVLAAPALAALLTTFVEDPAVAEDAQELSTFLLRFFVPQLVLYAVGAVATAVLHARRVFAVPAAAPIGNTVVIVACLLAFRAAAGADPGLDLPLGQRLLLAAAGTLGVAAFVAIPAVALRASGFRLRPRLARGDAAVRRAMALSGWGALQHAGAALLLLAAIVAGGKVEGGVIAYQVAFFVFLGPYAIVAQPLHTAILPRLSGEAARGDHEAMAQSVRWGLGAMAVWLLPVTAALVGLAAPAVRLISFGAASEGDGLDLMAAGVATFGVGLLAYGAFLLLTRAWYALGDTRTPAVAALVSAALGSVAMLVAAEMTTGTALLAALGLAHSAAFTLGALHLGIALRRRLGASLVPARMGRSLLVAAAVGTLAWAAVSAWDPDGRVATAAALLAVGAIGALCYVAAVRRLGALPPPLPAA